MSLNVFHSLDQTLNYLQDPTVTCKEVTELLELYKECSSKYVKNSDHRKYRFIVFEGLDGSGKSTMSRMGSKALNGVNLATPPVSIQYLRTHFDNCAPKLRRAYYSLGNYIASMQIQDELTRNHVIMDRFWSSTAAYALAESAEDLPERDSSVYTWPTDLIKPDIIIFLNVAEEERLRRTARRIVTLEEDKLKNDEQFRKRLYTVYSLMQDLVKFESNLPPKKEFNLIRETLLEPLLQKNTTQL